MTVSRKIVPGPATAALAVLALVFAVYGRGLFYSFVYDDRWTIVENVAVQRPTNLARFFLDRDTVAVPATGMGRTIYRPLPTLTFALDRALGARAPWRFRLANLLLHVTNGVLLWGLFRSLGLSFGASLAGSAAFLLHPAQVESVQWVTQRSNLMCLAGLLTALHFHRRGSAWSLAGLALALLSKETAVVAIALWPLFLWLEGPRIPPFQKGSARARWLAAGGLVAAYLLLRGTVIGGFAQRDFRGGGLDRRPPARDPFPLGIRKNSGLASGPSGQPTSIHRGSLDEPLDVGGARDRDRHRLGLVLFVASPSARLFLGGVGAADAPSGFGPCADGHLRGGTLSLRAPRRRGGRGGPFVGSFRRGGPAGPGLGARRLGGGVGSLGGAFLGAGGGLAGRTIALDFDGQPGPRTRLFVAVPGPGAGGKGPIPRSRGGIPSRFARRSYPRSRRGGADQFIGPSTSGRGSRGRPCLGR